MSDRPNVGAQAFPRMGHSYSLATGLTKREWTSPVQALAGLCANQLFTKHSSKVIAELAHVQASAMIARLNDERQPANDAAACEQTGSEGA